MSNFKNATSKVADKKIFLKEEYLTKILPKARITGTNFFNIISNEQENKFPTWLNLVKLNFSSTTNVYVETGTIYEDIIVNFLSQKNQCLYKTYQLSDKCFESNPYFDGRPDAEPTDNQGNFLYPQKQLVEIKTWGIDKIVNNEDELTGDNRVFMMNNKPVIERKDKSFQNFQKVINEFVDDANANAFLKKEKRDGLFFTKQKLFKYLFQVLLYMYLRKTNKGLIFIVFVETDEYTFEKDELKNVKRETFAKNLYENPDKSFSINVELVERFPNGMRDNTVYITRDTYDEYLTIAINWYKEHIEKGVSPVMTIQDRMLIEDLIKKEEEQ